EAVTAPCPSCGTELQLEPLSAEWGRSAEGAPPELLAAVDGPVAGSQVAGSPVAGSRSPVAGRARRRSMVPVVVVAIAVLAAVALLVALVSAAVALRLWT
ncbi:MAG: hypothetical protein ABMB14_31075, partial [Myxococcota bacterium]